MHAVKLVENPEPKCSQTRREPRTLVVYSKTSGEPRTLMQ